jgi:hypothetical protein
MLYSIQSYPLSVSSTSQLANLPPSQIDHLCSYISQFQEEYPNDSTRTKSESPTKRFAMPFPDMNRFLSTSHKLHHHEADTKGSSESSNKKHDFHAYLCSISKDSEEMSNFISIFIEEHGQAPAFNLFESCEQIAKRDQLESNEKSTGLQFNELSEFCSNRPQPRFAKRWRHSVGGPMSIDFIHQMLESRKVKAYPYSAEMDPYLVGR